MVVDAAESVALPDGHLDLVVHRLDAGVGDTELDRFEDAAASTPHLGSRREKW